MALARILKPTLPSALALTLIALALPGDAAAATQPPPLRAGVGRADITPPTGYALGGWTRADRVGTGVHTRLQASAVVLKSGKRKIALVAVDLFAAPGGLVAEAAERAAGASARGTSSSPPRTPTAARRSSPTTRP